ncbi:hypothetical protein [Sorangium sp. So ce233]|uniref:hypothetical protein n=1 Tax=Sorangium sp. So ce233 TaxID=3133290 RepID=UPI003F643F21
MDVGRTITLDLGRAWDVAPRERSGEQALDLGNRAARERADAERRGALTHLLSVAEAGDRQVARVLREQARVLPCSTSASSASTTGPICAAGAPPGLLARGKSGAFGSHPAGNARISLDPAEC